MGGDDLDVLYEQLKEQLHALRPSSGRQDEKQLTRDVEALRNHYPGFLFGIIAGGGQTAIEAMPGEGYEGDLNVLIRSSAEEIRAALKAEGVCPKNPAAADDAALSDRDP